MTFQIYIEKLNAKNSFIIITYFKMEKFNMYINLQNLLLSIEGYEEINKIKVFIEENYLFCNKTESLTTMRLLASIIYARPKLIDLTGGNYDIIHLVESRIQKIEISNPLNFIIVGENK